VELVPQNRTDIQAFLLRALTDSNQYRLTLRDGGQEIEYQPILELDAVKERILEYGNVYSHLIITSPLQWQLDVFAQFKIPTKIAFNPLSYQKQWSVTSKLSLLDDSHHECIDDDALLEMLKARSVGMHCISAYASSHINEQATNSPQEVHAHFEREMTLRSDHFLSHVKGGLSKLLSAVPPLPGHAVPDDSHLSRRVLACVEALEADYRRTTKIWELHEGNKRGVHDVPLEPAKVT
jgi:hypothetical protein